MNNNEAAESEIRNIRDVAELRHGTACVCEIILSTH